MITFVITPLLLHLRTDQDGEVGSAATSWAVPFRATPRHGARRTGDPKREPHRKTGGQPREEPPAGHLDRVWPDTDPVGNRLAAANDTSIACSVGDLRKVLFRRGRRKSSRHAGPYVDQRRLRTTRRSV